MGLIKEYSNNIKTIVWVCAVISLTTLNKIIILVIYFITIIFTIRVWYFVIYPIFIIIWWCATTCRFDSRNFRIWLFIITTLYVFLWLFYLFILLYLFVLLYLFHLIIFLWLYILVCLIILVFWFILFVYQLTAFSKHIIF